MVQSPILVVFIENAGRVAGVDLPRWASQLLDWTTEEYGKLAVRLQARRHYRQIVMLEDERATARRLLRTMLETEGVQPVNPMRHPGGTLLLSL